MDGKVHDIRINNSSGACCGHSYETVLISKAKDMALTIRLD